MAKKKKKEKSKKGLNKKLLANSIIGIFANNPSKTYNYKQLAKLLDIHDIASKQLITAVLYELSDNEMISEVYKGKFKLKSKGGYIIGKIDMTASGYAYVVSDESADDIFISQKNLNHALHGDTVKVYQYARGKRGNPEGEVVEILDRAKTTFVGTIEISKNFAFLVPDNKHMHYDLFIPFENLNHAKDGQKAIAEITDWPQKAKNPFGQVIEVLGEPGENETEIHGILAEFELPYKFAKDVEEEAEKIVDDITEADIKMRRDFRKTTTFTIDPHDAKDFDDALSLKKLENGNWEVGVHIADVTHYVKPKSLLDAEAFNRATSVYLVDRVVPMLPERLSNQICSLRPEEDKLCYSAVFEINENAEVIDQWFGRTVIHSNRRFTYEEAQQIIETGKGDLADEILILHKLAQIIRNERFSKGAIAFDREEVKFDLDKEGKPLGVFFKVQKEANQLIEEFMLLANKKVAVFVGMSNQQVDDQENFHNDQVMVYRVHDQPNKEKLQSFSRFISKFGYKISTGSNKKIATSLNKVLSDVKGKKEQNLVETLALRSMAKAEYSTSNIGHYGLSFGYYTHFTSPIRRYPDMMVHRILTNFIEKHQNKAKNILEKQCKHASEMEQRAVEVERASIKYKQVEFMSDKIGQVFDGVISGVTQWGIFVELVENKCEGMIPMQQLDDDFYEYDEDNYCIVGRYHKKAFQLGDELKVQIVKANLIKKQLDFMLV